MRMVSHFEPEAGRSHQDAQRSAGARQLSGSSRVTEPLRQSSDTIVTTRLELRLLTVDDAPHFVRLFENDWDAVKQTGRMPYPVTEAAMRDWIALHAAGSSRTFLMIRHGGSRADGRRRVWRRRRHAGARLCARPGVLGAGLCDGRRAGHDRTRPSARSAGSGSLHLRRESVICPGAGQGGIRRPGRGPSLLPQARRHAPSESVI